MIVRLLLVLAVIQAALASVALVGSDGVLKPSSKISKFVAGKVNTQTSAACEVVGVLDLTGGKGCEAVNSMLSTEFKESEVKNALCLDVTATQAVLATSFDEMFSQKYCGAKGTDLCATVADKLVVVFPVSDLDEYVLGHEQTLRRIVAKAKNGGSIRGVLFVLDTSETSEEPDASVIEKKFEAIWKDGADSETSPCPISVVTFNKGDEASIKSAQSALASFSTSSKPAGASELPGRVANVWGSIGKGMMAPVLSSGEMRAVYSIELAYMAAQKECEAAFSQWFKRVSGGKLIGKFGERVQALLDSTESKYMTATRGSSMVRLRGQRRRQVVDLINTTSKQLFSHQVTILQTEHTVRFRDLLASLVSDQSALTAEDASAELVDKSEEQQAIRQTLFEFRSQVLDLEVDRLGLTSEAAQAEFSQSLESFAKEFPESAYGRLEAVKKVEKLAKKAPRQKGGMSVGKNRAVNIGLNLVGMLRPPGFGNLQGFVGYSTGLFGLPLELLFGVQNDGDSPEIMGEDREHPILRLQPKIAFDCDL